MFGYYRKIGNPVLKGVFALFLLLGIVLPAILPSFTAKTLAAETDTKYKSTAVPGENSSAYQDGLDFLTNTAVKASLSKTGATSKSAYAIIGEVINWILAFVGILFLILIIYGGINWMTASGNEEKVAKATATFKQAVIGLVVVVAAFLLTNFVVFRILEIFKPIIK